MDPNRIPQLLILAFLLTAPLSGNAGQESPAEPSQPPHTEEVADVQTQPMEEITVIAERSRPQLRRELYRVHYEVLDMFNELNTDDDFDMVCKSEARIGSQIKYRVCKSRFHREMESEAYTDYLDGNMVSENRSELDRLYWQQRELMADLANKHPEFLALLRQRLELRKEYEQNEPD